jgi:hypothetical protein
MGILEGNGLEAVRCSSCGRFLGYMKVKDGVILLLCKNCKAWTVVAEGKTGKALTTEEIRSILKTVGQKA